MLIAGEQKGVTLHQATKKFSPKESMVELQYQFSKMMPLIENGLPFR
tara:strand:+ start:251 stop:391 length:141 start_codon:yes stop_codon:yes gene_type:complete